MRDYRDYEKKRIETSGCGCLVLAGKMDNAGVAARILKFGKGGPCEAYVVDKDADTGNCREEFRFGGWMRIYDDDGLTGYFEGRAIFVYRTGRPDRIIVKVIK